MSTRRTGSFLSRSFSALLTAVSLTIIVGLYLYFYQQDYTASVMMGPTQSAVRLAVESDIISPGPASEPVRITNDDRVAETARVARGITSANNISQAVYYLAGTQAVVRPQLTADLPQKDDVPYDKFIDEAKHAIGLLDVEEIRALEKSSGVPSDLWPDYLYLVDQMRAHDVSAGFLEFERLPKTVADLQNRVHVELRSDLDVVLTVEDLKPRRAEIMADALTVAFKDQYDHIRISSVKKQRDFFTDEYEQALHRYNRTMTAMWRGGFKVLPDNVPMDIRQASLQQQYRAVTRELAEIAPMKRQADNRFQQFTANDCLLVSYWAGESPGTRQHVQTPATAAPKRLAAQLAVLFVVSFIGSLIAFSVMGVVLQRVAEARGETAREAPEVGEEALPDACKF